MYESAKTWLNTKHNIRNWKLKDASIKMKKNNKEEKNKCWKTKMEPKTDLHQWSKEYYKMNQWRFM